MKINKILGYKIEQTQIFDNKNLRIPVTKIQAGPCVVLEKHTVNGKTYCRIGFGIIKKPNKPTQGLIKGAGLTTAPRFIRELEISEEMVLGQEIKASDVFNIGDLVKVSGISKGKGFAGVVKRHGFKGGPKTHGQSDRERAPGAIGSTTTPGRVYRGKHMAGRMGGKKITVKGLKIMSIDTGKNLIFVKGLIPGAKNSLVEIIKQ